MTATLIGYARCSTERQDLAAQRQALLELGVAEDRIYTDHGLTGTNRARPGLDQALAAVREGDTLVVPKLVVSHACNGRMILTVHSQFRSQFPKPCLSATVISGMTDY